MKRRSLSSNRRTSGISLAEMVVVIAVIAIFTAFAMSIFGGIRERVQLGVRLQNAHAVSNMAMAVLSTGNPEFEGLTTKEEVVTKVVEGVVFTGADGTLSTATLGIAPSQIAGFLDLLDWNPSTRILSLKRN